MRRWLLLLLAGSCVREPRAPDSPPSAPPATRADTPRFTRGEVSAYHECVATAPPTVSLLLKADTGTDWIQIDLAHGPRDRVPRRFTIGPGLPNRGTGCWMARRCGVEAAGTVDLEVLEPGKRAAGRYRFSLDGSPEVEAAFEATWMEGVWAVRPCPTPS